MRLFFSRPALERSTASLKSAIVTSFLALAGRQQCRFVDHVGQVGADETAGDRGQRLHVDVGIDLDVLQVDFDDLLAAGHVGPIDQHVAIETAGPQQGGIERFGPVGGAHHDHAAVGVEAVHLDEQRVERLLAFVVAADVAAAAGLAQGVELVDEDDAGRLLLGLLEHVAHAGGADADEHFDEVGAAEAEKRHARLAGHRFGEQRLAGARRADQQHALGNAAAEHLVFLGRLQELDDFAQLLDGFVDAGHVFERDFDVFLGVQLAAAAAERHRRAGPAHAADHEDEQHHQQGRHQQQRHVAEQRHWADPRSEYSMPFFVEQARQALLLRIAIDAQARCPFPYRRRLVPDSFPSLPLRTATGLQSSAALPWRSRSVLPISTI